MTLAERIQKDLQEAIKARDELRTSVLRMLKAALREKEIEKMGPLEAAEQVQVLQTLLKQRREAIAQFTRGGRSDLAERETAEIAILEAYLPPAPSEEELQAAIEAAIAETGARSPAQMGAVIKAVRARLEGRALDGRLLSERVRQRLERAG
jgi:uncharacterized protein YqeY